MLSFLARIASAKIMTGKVKIISTSSKTQIYILTMKFKFVDPVQVIRPVDPIVFDRIRVGFHRNPTSFIKNRSDPIEIFRSDRIRSSSLI